MRIVAQPVCVALYKRTVNPPTLCLASDHSVRGVPDHVEISLVGRDAPSVIEPVSKRCQARQYLPCVTTAVLFVSPHQLAVWIAFTAYHGSVRVNRLPPVEY